MPKNYVKVGIGIMKTKTYVVLFFKCSLNFEANALQLELTKVRISTLVKFERQSMSFKIEGAFEKRTKFPN